MARKVKSAICLAMVGIFMDHRTRQYSGGCASYDVTSRYGERHDSGEATAAEPFFMACFLQAQKFATPILIKELGSRKSL